MVFVVDAALLHELIDLDPLEHDVLAILDFLERFDLRQDDLLSRRLIVYLGLQDLELLRNACLDRLCLYRVERAKRCFVDGFAIALKRLHAAVNNVSVSAHVLRHLVLQCLLRVLELVNTTKPHLRCLKVH